MVGITSTVIELPEETSEEELLNKIYELNDNDDITGILVQMPLPSHIDKNKVVCARTDGRREVKPRFCCRKRLGTTNPIR